MFVLPDVLKAIVLSCSLLLVSLLNVSMENLIVYPDNEIAVESQKNFSTSSSYLIDTPYTKNREGVDTNYLDEINIFRASLSLSEFQNHSDVCDFARTRAREVQTEFNHSGFNSRFEKRTLPYSSFSRAAENIANAPTFEKALTLWKQSPGHNQNLLSPSPYACVANSGNYYVFEVWTP